MSLRVLPQSFICFLLLRGRVTDVSPCSVLSFGTVDYTVKGVVTFECVDKILKYDHSNESY